MVSREKDRENYTINILEDIIEERHFDIIILSMHYQNLFFKQSDVEIENTFNYLKKHTKKIVWIDPLDSTGTCTFQALPYVDLYFSPLYGGWLHASYYHEKYGIITCEDIYSSNDVLPVEYIYKLELAWNVG